MDTHATQIPPELAAALVAAQADLGNVAKDRANPHFKSRYATLEAVTDATRGALAAHGLALVQMPVNVDGGIGVTTMLVHTSGAALTSTVSTTTTTADPQKMGSAITYLRRYAALSMTYTAPADDDDDGNAARPSATQREQAKARAQTPPQNSIDLATFKRDLPDGVRIEDVNEWRRAMDRPTVDALTDAQRFALMRYLHNDGKDFRSFMVDTAAGDE